MSFLANEYFNHQQLCVTAMQSGWLTSWFSFSEFSSYKQTHRQPIPCIYHLLHLLHLELLTWTLLLLEAYNTLSPILLGAVYLSRTHFIELTKSVVNHFNTLLPSFFLQATPQSTNPLPIPRPHLGQAWARSVQARLVYYPFHLLYKRKPTLLSLFSAASSYKWPRSQPTYCQYLACILARSWLEEGNRTYVSEVILFIRTAILLPRSLGESRSKTGLTYHATHRVPK